MEAFDRTIRYLFILGVLFLFFAYFAGANALGGTLFSGVNGLLLTGTGRNQQGQLAGYAKQN